jgi:hypothetical protein
MNRRSFMETLAASIMAPLVAKRIIEKPQAFAEPYDSTWLYYESHDDKIHVLRNNIYLPRGYFKTNPLPRKTILGG